MLSKLKKLKEAITVALTKKLIITSLLFSCIVPIVMISGCTINIKIVKETCPGTKVEISAPITIGDPNDPNK